MYFYIKKIRVWLYALRAYSLPISIMSWFVPFLFALMSEGSIKYGIIALIGIIFLHLATNIFDDAIDYTREKKEIDKGNKKEFNFQKNKCASIFSGEISLKQHYIAAFFLYLFSLIIAIYFIGIYGIKLLHILIPSAFLCLFYPILGCLGLGELIVAIVFSPLMYLGVFYTMTGQYNLDILIISISTGLLSVAVLHNHMLLDFKFDEKNRKTTLCRLCKTEKKALYLLGFIIIGAFTNIIIGVIAKELHPLYLITLFSLPTAITLYHTMSIHIKDSTTIIKPNFFMGSLRETQNVTDEEKGFLIKFLIVRNLLSLFTLLICIAIVLIKFI